MSTPSADASAVILTNKLRNKEPFVFTKFGDGTLWWMSGKPVQSANGEVYRPGIDKELRDAARTLAKLPHVYFGDQLTCSSGPYLGKEQARYIRLDKWTGDERVPPSRWLHMETLLIHRLTPELLEFYRVLKTERQRVVFCGGDHLRLAMVLFARNYYRVNSSNAHEEVLRAIEVLSSADYWRILLLAAGHASKLIAAALASKFPDRTIIELGSALDPLFVGRTRSEQIEPAAAREYFKELGDPT